MRHRPLVPEPATAGTPRRVLAAAGGLALVATGWTASAATGATVRDGALTGQLVVAAVLVLGSAREVARQARRGGTEAQVWSWASRALLVVGLGILVQAALTLGALLGPARALDPGLRGSVLSVAVLAATPVLYQGLVRWNRFTTVTSDPGDWLNGLSAVLVMTAIGDLVLPWASSPLEVWPWWQLQSWLLGTSSVLMLVGTAATIAVIGGLLHDRRVWSIAAALLLVAVVDNSTVIARVGQAGLDGWPAATWSVAAVAVAAASRSITAPLRTRPATTQAPTIGGLLVLAVAVAVLVVATRTPTDTTWAVALAAATAAMAGLRIVALVRSLSTAAQRRAAALTDDLTGLPNRQALQAALVAATGPNHTASLLVIDLDGFREVNDRFGQHTGDELLRLAAAALRREVGSRGVVARLGGDEFAVLFPDAGVDLATEVAWGMVEATRSPVVVAGRPLVVRGSLGIAANGREPAGDGPRADAAARAEDLLVRATTAMQMAKADGGRQIRVYDGQVAELLAEQSLRLEELRVLLGSPDAVRDVPPGELVTHYQPQVDLRTGRVLGVEALVRWQHPRLGLVGPAAFLDLVERHGLMDRLTATVLRQAARQAVAWREDGLTLRVSVNLSATCLGDPGLLPLLDAVLAETTLRPQDLVLEVTETSLMADPASALEQLRTIADRGVGISIDDYGTGYSSLGYLNDLPATELKIDRSFISRLLSDGRTAAIVAGTVTLAHHLGLRLVAEGVEDEATLAAVHELGFDEVQGYVHSRPLPADGFAAWLGTRPAPGCPAATAAARTA